MKLEAEPFTHGVFDVLHLIVGQGAEFSHQLDGRDSDNVLAFKRAWLQNFTLMTTSKRVPRTVVVYPTTVTSARS
jgi:hypothetical protein